MVVVELLHKFRYILREGDKFSVNLLYCEKNQFSALCPPGLMCQLLQKGVSKGGYIAGGGMGAGVAVRRSSGWI